VSNNAMLENLAKLARLITMGQPLRGQAVGEAIDLCVIEWRNDKARIEALEKENEQWRAQYMDDTAPSVRPMTRLEHRLMDLEGELGTKQARIEALERVWRATEVINTTTHEASKGVYLGKPCAHGNLPVYPIHARWCDECWQELEDALMAALRGEEETP